MYGHNFDKLTQTCPSSIRYAWDLEEELKEHESLESKEFQNFMKLSESNFEEDKNQFEDIIDEMDMIVNELLQLGSD